MASKVKCGIYVIEQIDCQNYYIGSSKSVHARWSQHRLLLNRGKHHSPYLQNTWAKYGETAFRFWIIEECEPSELLAKEQEYLDALNPVFNVCPLARSRAGSKYTPEQLVRHQAIHSARAALITHCPHGHEYTEENMMTKKGKKVRICLVCNAMHVKASYTTETPEQRERRRQRAAVYAATNEKRKAKQREYNAAHAAEKYVYDVNRRALAYEQKRILRLERTPEQHAVQLAQKRQSYLRHRETILARQRDQRTRTIPAPRIAPTHCPAGHLYEGENLRIDKNGFRHCRACAKIQSHEKRLTRTPEQRAKLLEQKRRYYHQDGDKNRVLMRERYHKKKAVTSL